MLKVIIIAIIIVYFVIFPIAIFTAVDGEDHEEGYGVDDDRHGPE